MLERDCIILVGVGGFFVILGLLGIVWGRSEEKSYYNALSTRSGDTREFLERWPLRPQSGALKVGGWIAVAIGVVMLITGGALWLWG